MGLPNAQECDHLSSHFWFEKQSHVTRVVNFWRQNQLSLVSLNSRSTCFGSINSKFHCLQIKQTSARIFCIFGSTESCLSTGDVPGNSFHKNLIFLKNWVQVIKIEIRRFGKKNVRWNYNCITREIALCWQIIGSLKNKWFYNSKLNCNNCNVFFLKKHRRLRKIAKNHTRRRKLLLLHGWSLLVMLFTTLSMGWPLVLHIPVQDLLVSVRHLRYSVRSCHMNLVSSN